MDPYQYLEEVESEDAFGFAMRETEKTLEKFTKSNWYQKKYDSLYSYYADKDKPPEGWTHDGWYYNYLRSKDKPRGIWRRCLVADFGSWETILDLETIPGSWAFSRFIFNEYKKDGSGMLFLSDGGKDAAWGREFSVTTKSFIQGGFELPLGKRDFTWSGVDSILFGDGKKNKSDHHCEIYSLNRGETLVQKELVFSASEDHTFLGIGSVEDESTKQRHQFILDCIDFDLQNTYLLSNHQAIPLDMPQESFLIGIRSGVAYIFMNQNTETFKKGSILTCDLKAGSKFSVFWDAKAASQPISEAGIVQGRIYFLMMNNCQNTLGHLEDGVLKPLFDDVGISTSIYAVDTVTDEMLICEDSFLFPKRVYKYDPLLKSKTLLWQGKQFWDGSSFQVNQYWCLSHDGTKIPYFVVSPKGSNSPQKAILYGYGGFQGSLTPAYMIIRGKGWLDAGNTFVVANIRGGEEFGNDWHKSVLKMNRKKCFEDFASVAMDLVGRGITTKKQLGIQGASNGGLLVGATMTSFPDICSAVVCEVPLLDMERYQLLLVGRSWAAEYGTVEDNPEMKAYIESYSPYRQVSIDQKYPPILFKTSTYDDRVHPGHARKMYAKMKDQGHEAWYFEEKEGGHGASLSPETSARGVAINYVFFEEKLQG